MKVRNVGRIVIAKGIELDRDINPGETTQVKPGYEQSERVLSMIHSGSLVAISITNIKSQGSTVAVQPGVEDPFAEFGKPLPLPTLTLKLQQANEEFSNKETEEVFKPEPAPEIKEAITSQLIGEKEKTTFLNSPPNEPIDNTPSQQPVEQDEMTEFLRRNGGARIKFIQQMKNTDILRSLLDITKTEKTRQVLEARLKTLLG